MHGGIIAPLEWANELGGKPDFNNESKLGKGKVKTDLLTNLINIFNRLELDFSAKSGKSKGQFYTPAEVSRLIARILLSFSKTPIQYEITFYDPTCGPGSLLLKISTAADGKRSLYGQEKDNSTAVLARMNMILHGMPTAEIKQGNTTIMSKKKNTIKSNRPFDDVKGLLASSPLKLNRDLAQEDVWNVEKITQRSKKLAEKICKIWPYDIPE